MCSSVGVFARRGVSLCARAEPRVEMARRGARPRKKSATIRTAGRYIRGPVRKAGWARKEEIHGPTACKPRMYLSEPHIRTPLPNPTSERGEEKRDPGREHGGVLTFSVMCRQASEVRENHAGRNRTACGRRESRRGSPRGSHHPGAASFLPRVALTNEHLQVKHVSRQSPYCSAAMCDGQP